MLRELIYFVSCLILYSSVQAKNTIPKLSKSEQISVIMFATGDFTEKYEFTGPMGVEIIAGSVNPDPICNIISLFRKVKYRETKSIEAWLRLECTFEGQKSIYKAHRIYLNLEESVQKVKLPRLAKNLKNVQLEFRELSLKSNKK